MEYVYGAMLLHSAGQPITEENVEKVLKAAGVKTDAARVKALVASLEGVNIEEAIKSATAIPVAASAAATAPTEKKEKKKEEKKEEVSQDEAAAGLSALFD